MNHASNTFKNLKWTQPLFVSPFASFTIPLKCFDCPYLSEGKNNGQQKLTTISLLGSQQNPYEVSVSSPWQSLPRWVSKWWLGNPSRQRQASVIGSNNGRPSPKGRGFQCNMTGECHLETSIILKSPNCIRVWIGSHRKWQGVSQVFLSPLLNSPNMMHLYSLLKHFFNFPSQKKSFQPSINHPPNLT